MLNQQKKNLIFLTGYMGAGKSTIGRKLARVLRYRFIDTDKALERKFKMGMSDIFKTEGEATFRLEEERLIEKLSKRFNYVISAGGGTLTRTETFYTAQRAGILVYLQAPVQTLYERAIFSQKDRPLINQPNSDQLFEKRFREREPYYIRSDLTVCTLDKSSEEVVEEIVQWLKQP